ncbi:sensor domain-containing diguanylate cyclase [Aquabacter cavernae]|uniref:sensor domain-containing diguanylate cyclase n=1 Tax=Aquabacter cavernae TaxID=2496029 RepID=UPI000F8DD43D|nr:sensor domain-containing diguanylate cyclase [Aquabacter cavernae]
MVTGSRRLFASRSALFFAFALVFAFILLQAVTLWQARQDAWRAAIQSAENVQSTLRVSIERNLALLELSLIGVQDTLKIDGLDAMPPSLRNTILFDRASSAQFLGSLLVLDDQGHIKYDSASPTPRTLHLGDRDYFTAQREKDAGTYLSHPFRSRLRNNDPSITVSRRLNGPGGAFQGVAAATMRLAFFTSIFKEVKLRPGDVITLILTDGTIVLRHPPTENGADYLGENMSASPIFQRMLHGAGPFEERSRIDGTKRFYVHSRVANFPLILSVGFSVPDAMAEWRQRALIISGVTLAMSAGIIALVLALRRMLMRSYRMEETLELAALTDSLTGLANRRAFDDALQREWKRANRNKTPLSLIVLDGDHFKAINDEFGHAGGDLVLQMIADRLSRAVRRPSDVVARYGGEEFVVLLPNTLPDGALNVAENIRGRVNRARITLSDGRVLAATVSLGVSSMGPGDEKEQCRLFQEADAALYQAKQSGRDSIVVFQGGVVSMMPHNRTPMDPPGTGA